MWVNDYEYKEGVIKEERMLFVQKSAAVARILTYWLVFLPEGKRRNNFPLISLHNEMDNGYCGKTRKISP